MLPDTFNNKFFKNPSTYSLIKYSESLSDEDWERISLTIERDFTFKEWKLFYNKISVSLYLHDHDISDDVFYFLATRDRISFADRYNICRKPGRVNDGNINMICEDNHSLWCIAFKNNDISEETMLSNHKILLSGANEFRKLIEEKIKESDSEKYLALRLLLEL